MLSHNLILSESNSQRLVVMPLPGTFINRHLLVSIEEIIPGEEIKTYVFNLSTSRVRLPSGEAISHILNWEVAKQAAAKLPRSQRARGQ